MKRLISILICIMMLAGLAVGTSAAGEIIWTDDFNSGALNPNNWFVEGNLFFIDDMTDASNPCLAAYSDGVVCQMEYRYDISGTPRLHTNFAMSTKVQARDVDSDGDHEVGLWWRDDFVYISDADGGDGGIEPGEIWNFMVDIDKSMACLLVEGEEVNRAEAPVTGVEMGGDWFTMGWRIVPGRITCYVNNVKVIDYASEDISAASPSPILLINSNLYVAFDDLVVATADYNLFNEADLNVNVPVTTAGTEGSDNNGDDNNQNNNNSNQNQNNNNNNNNNNAPVGTSSVVTSVVTDAEGNTSIVTEIITDAPADTNNGAPAGGNSTTTGDATFVVIVAMVTALGCALVVKKVNAK